MNILHNNILAAHQARELNWRLIEKLVFIRHPGDAAATAVRLKDSQGRASDARSGETSARAAAPRWCKRSSSAVHKPETGFAILF
jgi:hypothetical protein